MCHSRIYLLSLRQYLRFTFLLLAVLLLVSEAPAADVVTIEQQLHLPASADIQVPASNSVCSSGAPACSFQGSTCVCTTGPLDGVKPITANFDADPSLETIFISGSRVFVQDPDGSISLSLNDNWSGYTWKLSGAHIMLVGTNKQHVVVRYGKPNGYPWGPNLMKVNALFDGPLVPGGTHYSLGQEIAALPVSLASAQQSIKGDTMVLPGESGVVWFSDGGNVKTAVFDLSVSTTGEIGITNRFALNQNGNHGNGATRSEVCNAEGCIEVLFTTDIIHMADGSIVGSWLNTNGHPALQGYTFGYTVSNHVDSTVLISFKDPFDAPGQMACITYENGRAICAEVVLSSLYPPQVDLIPIAIDPANPNCGGSGVGAEAISHIVSIEGLPSVDGGYIVNGCRVYRARDIWHLRGQSGVSLTGVIQPLTNGFYFDEVATSLPRGLNEGELLFSRYYGFKGVSSGGEAQTLQQIFPEVVSVSASSPFHGLGPRAYAYHASGGNGQFTAYYGNQNGGIPRAVSAGFRIHSLANGRNRIEFLLTAVNSPRQATVWRFDDAHGFEYNQVHDLLVHAAALAYVQQSDVARGFDSYRLHDVLKKLDSTLPSQSAFGSLGLPSACPGSNSAVSLAVNGTLEPGSMVTLTAKGFEAGESVHLGVSDRIMSPGLSVAGALQYSDISNPQYSWTVSRPANSLGQAAFTFQVPQVTVGTRFVAQAFAACSGSSTSNLTVKATSAFTGQVRE